MWITPSKRSLPFCLRRKESSAYLWLTASRDGAAPVLTAFLDHLQHASATAQIVGCVLSFIAIGLGPFVPGLIADHIAAARAAR